MKILWAQGPSGVHAVAAALPGSPLAYTTVQTMLNVLHRKGKVKRKLKDRAYEYAPTVSRLEATKASMSDIIDRLFGGSAESLVMGLVETRQLSPESLKKLQEKIEEAGDGR
ncbi:MAG: BlaI/MecI/CopY family transcriptional regulator [Acidobacteria bacterium]|nr:BlaI/MecI/CopY family transcriptional regulator [Acidobacteriota bacterium]